MARPGVVAILTRFENLTDPRIERSKQHLLIDMVTIALCAPFAARIVGSTSRSSAWPSGTGLLAFSSFPTAFPRTIRSAACLPAWIRRSSCAACRLAAVAAPVAAGARRRHRRQDALRVLRRRQRQVGLAPRQRLGQRPAAVAGTGRGRWQVERNHGCSQTLGAAGVDRGGGDHGRHALSEGNARRDPRQRGRLPRARQGQPAQAAHAPLGNLPGLRRAELRGPGGQTMPHDRAQPRSR